ncbi:MAG: phosphate transport system substrate-binding protein [Frankiales bacterium]|nr:phosphate transport system substrate-binding protein [Frankiales bacterium]MDX6245315.1 phosphate transport system substrate-binding protein [Frankiales bacterium]
MKHTRTGGLVALASMGIVSSLALSACGSNSNGATAASTSSSAAGAATGSAATGSSAAGGSTTCASGSLSGAGSSFQGPMQQQWAKDFAAKCSGAKVDYQPVGSGAGIQQFGAGTVDFAGSDVPMKTDEQATADKTCGSPAWHLPISAGGVGVTWNLPGVTDLTFSAATLADIFDGKLKTWNDPEIKADNPSATLPSTPISVVYRADSSGTNAVFTGYLDAAAKANWKLGTGKTITWPAGQGAQKSAGVAAAVKQTPGAITYVEQAFATTNQLPLAKIKNGSTAVALTTDSVTAAIAGATISGTGNLVATVNYAPTDPKAYPISTLTYVIVCSKYKSASKVPLLKAYLGYAAGAGQAAATGLGFAPLPSAIADKVATSIAAIS